MMPSAPLIVVELCAQVAAYERIERLVKAGKTSPDALKGAATTLGKAFSAMPLSYSPISRRWKWQ
jgi:hypothetical protein